MLEGLVYQEACCETKQAINVEKSTLDNLKSRKLKLELSLKEVQEAIIFLEQNPSFAQGLELVGKALRR